MSHLHKVRKTIDPLGISVALFLFFQATTTMLFGTEERNIYIKYLKLLNFEIVLFVTVPTLLKAKKKKKSPPTFHSQASFLIFEVQHTMIFLVPIILRCSGGSSLVLGYCTTSTKVCVCVPPTKHTTTAVQKKCCLKTNGARRDKPSFSMEQSPNGLASRYNLHDKGSSPRRQRHSKQRDRVDI